MKEYARNMLVQLRPQQVLTVRKVQLREMSTVWTYRLHG